MMYTLYHVVTGTRLDENGLPWWCDVFGLLWDLIFLGYAMWGLSYLTGGIVL